MSYDELTLDGKGATAPDIKKQIHCLEFCFSLKCIVSELLLSFKDLIPTSWVSFLSIHMWAIEDILTKSELAYDSQKTDRI